MGAKLNLSEVLATNHIMNVVYGMTDRPIPEWDNFFFFSRIKAGPIRTEKKCLESIPDNPYWHAERVVEFYIRRKVVAKITMMTERHGGPDKEGPYEGWATVKVEYARKFLRFEGHEPENWIVFEHSPGGTTYVEI